MPKEKAEKKNWVVRKPSHAFFTVFSITGTICLIAGYFCYSSTSDFVNNGISANGKVVEIVSRSSRSSSGGQSSVVYSPKVTFTTSDGKEVTFTSTNATNPATHEVGEEVEIFYKKDNPENAIINSFFNTWFLPLLFLSIGAVSAAIAGLALYFIVNGDKILSAANKKIEMARATGRLEEAENLLKKFDQSENS